MTVTVTDLFCGAGGSSTGLASLPGVKIVMAANHWALAIQSHQTNHPDTDHDSADLSQVEPSRFPRTTMLWASPECTNHTVAKGIKRHRDTQAQLPGLEEKLPDDAAVRSRATMWDVPRFAEYHRYEAIIIENVVEAYRWVQFPAWLLAMELIGYEHEIVWMNSMHAQARGLPAPQSRDRMYVVFWRKGNRAPDLQKWTRPEAFCAEHGVIRAAQAFKKAEHWGRYRAQYVYRCPKCAIVVEPGWLPAAAVIDWSLPGQRIGDREKPLADKTRARIAAGIDRYWRPMVVEAAGNQYDSMDPRHAAHGKADGYIRAWPAEEAFRTLHTSATKAIAVPVEGRDGKSAAPMSAPLRTQSTRNETGVAFPPFLAQFRERERLLDPARDALTTVVADGANHALLVPAGGTWRDSSTSSNYVMPTRTSSETDALVVPLRNHGVAKKATGVIDTVAANGNHHALVMTNTHTNRARPVEEALPTSTTATTHALLMRNNQGGAEMSTPAAETMRTLTTGGHQSLLAPGAPISLDVDDCMFRMLEPHEIQLGMAFPETYVLLGNKREKVKQAGNAVTPPNARDLGAAVIESLGYEVEMGWVA